MKLAVVGGRDFIDYEHMNDVLHAIHNRKAITVLVSGGARGADSLAANWARQRDIEVVEFMPDWEKYGKSAGFKRNSLIINEADACVAFWDGKSKGTKSSIDLARKREIPLKIIKYED